MVMKAIGLIISIPSFWYAFVLFYLVSTYPVNEKTMDIVTSGILFIISGSLGLLIFQMSKLIELMKGKMNNA